MTSLQSTLAPHLELQTYEHYEARTLVIESAALKSNPLGDTNIRRNPVLVPKTPAPKRGWPVIFVLAGFTGNGPAYFNVKGFEPNMPAVIDTCRARGEAPAAVFVFCDAWTSWGGSQFINSEGTGLYEDYILEIVQEIKRVLQVSPHGDDWCVTGGSSGGYGALHLASRHPETFGLCGAIAADSFFDASLLPEIYKSMPTIVKLGGVHAIRQELASGRFMKRKEAHTVLNAVAMGLCYAPKNGAVEWPIDVNSGVLIPETWQKWKQHDPLEFLPTRIANLSRLRRIYLDVGTRDQFHLQFGTRQIARLFEIHGLPFDSTEFDGTHFDIGERRPELWRWLTTVLGG